MKAADLMRAMDSRPDALEAAAPSPRNGDRKPDISAVLGKIRGDQQQSDIQAPAVKIEQAKRPRLIPALLAGCSIAACAAVVTGLAFFIRDSHGTAEQSSDVAMMQDSTGEADEDLAVEPVSEQTAEAAESEAESATKTEPAEHDDTQNNLIVTAKTEPVSGTAQSDAQPAPKTEPASSDTAIPTVTAKTVPTTAVHQQNDETLVRITYQIPNFSVLMPGMFHIELFDYADSKKISGFDLFSGEPGGDFGIVEVVIPDGTTQIIAALYNNENNQKAEIGTFPIKVQNGAAEPIKLHIADALDKLCTAEPAQTEIPVLRTIEKDHTLPAPSFIYQWNSDQYQALDTALHYESAAAWKNRRMSDGDRAIYAETNDGFRYLDEHADSVSYLWFMYEADGAVPEVRQMEISDQSGIWIKAALCPADVHGKVRVMIPLDEEVPAWIGDVTDQWRLELAENGVFKHDPIQTHWYFRIDQTSSIAPVP